MIQETIIVGRILAPRGSRSEETNEKPTTQSKVLCQ